MQSKYTSDQVSHFIQRLMVINVQWQLGRAGGIPQATIDQARRISSRFAELGFRFDFSFSAPTPAALVTQELTVSKSGAGMVTIQDLDPTAFLTRYNCDGRPEGIDLATHEIYRHNPVSWRYLALGEIALEVILDIIKERKLGNSLNCVVFGYGPLLSGLIRTLLQIGNPDNSIGNQEEKLNALRLGEGEGVSLRYNPSPEYTGYWFEHEIRQSKQP